MRVDEKNFILVGESGFEEDHYIGDKECRIGWCDAGMSYPKECPHCNGGLIHAAFGDENADCEYWLYTKCDKCGESE